MDTQLTGRKEECRRLSMCVSEDSAQLIVVYGRRRIGKTWLIEKFFDGDFAFRMTGEYDAPANMQLRNRNRKTARQSSAILLEAKRFAVLLSGLWDFVLFICCPSLSLNILRGSAGL